MIMGLTCGKSSPDRSPTDSDIVGIGVDLTPEYLDIEKANCGA